MTRELLATDLHWADVHARTLCQHDETGRLARWNGFPGEETRAPILLFARTLHGNLWRLRAGLPEPLIRELARLCGAERTAPLPPAGTSPIDSLIRSPERWPTIEERVLRCVAIEERWSGLAYRFPEGEWALAAGLDDTELLPDDALDELAEAFPALADRPGGRAPCAVVRRDGRIVSACHAATLAGPGGAVEAGVATLPGHRGRGFASAVVGRFAAEVRRRGGVPLYSTALSNRASVAVADKLRLIPYAAVFQLR